MVIMTSPLELLGWGGPHAWIGAVAHREGREQPSLPVMEKQWTRRWKKLWRTSGGNRGNRSRGKGS